MNNSLYKCPICGEPTNYSSINYQPQPCLKCSPRNVNHIPGNVLVVDAGLPKGAEAPFYPTAANTPAPTPWEVKEGYWHEQYQLMRERYNRQIGENSKLAERIKDLTFLVTELQPNRDYADRIRELEDQLKAKQGENHELYAMLSHIVDWSPELPFYMKDEYKTLFRNALAAARELLSKCSVKEGKPKQGPIENIIDGLHNQSADLSTEELASELKEDGIDLDGLKKRVSRLIAEAKRQKEGK